MIEAKFGEPRQGMEIFLLKKLYTLYAEREYIYQKSEPSEYRKDMLRRIDERLKELGV